MNKIPRTDVRHILSLPLAKRVDIHLVEKWSTSFWKNSVGKVKLVAGQPFAMMFPPPNVTGKLHLGHALTAAIQDALIRQRQMLGHEVVWIPGFDHAGLATQNIVENLLWKERGITRQQLGRNEFVQLVNEWKEVRRSEMRNQLSRLGLVLDNEKEYFTMDEKSSLAVHAAFKQLFRSKVIYRETKTVFWSEKLQTTLSDIEVERVDGVDRYIRTGEVVGKRPLSQWFVDAKEMSFRAAKVVENCSIEMIPQNYKRSWSSWLIENGVQDWCISRQSWWGHRIPAYKLQSAEDVRENWIVADSHEEAARLLGDSDNVVQDPDVLDTWFSSSLLPLTISGWPSPKEFTESQERGHFPLHVMETGFDILTYWVSKMVMMSLALEGKIPFKLILLHGMICDSHGKKMSKSKGNVIDPIDIIDGVSIEDLQNRTISLHAQGFVEDSQIGSVLDNQKKLFPDGIPACGADGLRAYLLSHDFQEEIVRIRILQIDKIRRLTNKVWNVARFAISMIESSGYEDLSLFSPDLHQKSLDESDITVLKHLAKCVYESHRSFKETYDLHKAFASIELFWNMKLSADYIQHVRSVLHDENSTEADRKLKLEILTTCVITSTKLLHPFMPHLTEFLYQKLLSKLDKSHVYQPMGLASYPSLEEWEKYLE